MKNIFIYITFFFLNFNYSYSSFFNINEVNQNLYSPKIECINLKKNSCTFDKIISKINGDILFTQKIIGSLPDEDKSLYIAILLRESEGKPNSKNYFKINGEKSTIIKDSGITQINLKTLREFFKNDKSVKTLKTFNLHKETNDFIEKFIKILNDEMTLISDNETKELSLFFLGKENIKSERLIQIYNQYSELMNKISNNPTISFDLTKIILSEKRKDLFGNGVERVKNYTDDIQLKKYFPGDPIKQALLKSFFKVKDIKFRALLSYNANHDTYPNKPVLVSESYAIDLMTTIAFLENPTQESCFEIFKHLNEKYFLLSADYINKVSQWDGSFPPNQNLYFQTCEKVKKSCF